MLPGTGTGNGPNGLMAGVMRKKTELFSGPFPFETTASPFSEKTVRARQRLGPDNG